MAITNGTYGDYMTWTLDSDTGILTIDIEDGQSIGNGNWNTSLVKTVVINGLPVAINNSVFKSHRYLTSITIPSSVTSIGEFSFGYCSALKSITIPDSVIRLWDCAFYGSGLESVVIPNSVTNIGAGTFADCAHLKWIIIPDSVTGIKKDAFVTDNVLQSIYYSGSEAKWAEFGVDLSATPNVTVYYDSLMGAKTVALKQKGEDGTYRGYAVKTNVNSVDGLRDELKAKANTTDIPTVPTIISAFTNDSGYTKQSGFTSHLGWIAKHIMDRNAVYMFESSSSTEKVYLYKQDGSLVTGGNDGDNITIGGLAAGMVIFVPGKACKILGLTTKSPSVLTFSSSICSEYATMESGCYLAMGNNEGFNCWRIG